MENQVPSSTLPNSQPSSPESPSLQKSGPNFLVWIVGGLVMLIIGVSVGLALGKYSQTSPPILPVSSPIFSYEDCVDAKGSIVQMSYPAACVTEDGKRFTQPLTDEEKQNLLPPDQTREPTGSTATANWKTYQITNDPATGYPDYEIKLPLGWKQIEHSSNFQGSETFQDSRKEGSIRIDILKNSSKSLTGFLAELDKENQTGWEGQPSRQILKTQTTKRGTYDVVEREESWLAAGFTAKVVYIPTNNFVFSIAVFPYNAGGSPLTEALNSFDQILSTFKFLDSSQTSSECGVCGPKGLHNVEGKTCASGFECKSSDNGVVSSVGFCVKSGESIQKCL